MLQTQPVDSHPERSIPDDGQDKSAGQIQEEYGHNQAAHFESFFKIHTPSLWMVYIIVEKLLTEFLWRPQKSIRG